VEIGLLLFYLDPDCYIVCVWLLNKNLASSTSLNLSLASSLAYEAVCLCLMVYEIISNLSYILLSQSQY